MRNQSVDESLPKSMTVIDADIERKNALLKSILEKATYLRKKDWTKQDEFVLQFYPKV
ncbi:hypothetical protein [Peribacillus simplex]|uniref:hypothetical protein n=1 Tax=Peribacillus simplex TaxID=1478 RepID=UPI001624B491|nr:hypothetical protein [Peribacillus simplex]